MLAVVPQPVAIISQVVGMPSQQLTKEEAGALLRSRREAMGLTQDQVVDQAGIPTITQLSEYENGKVNIARSKYLPKLAAVLRLREEDIRSINPSAVFTAAPEAAEDADSRSAPRQPMAQTRRLPQGLQAAVDTYGKRFEDLRDPKWQQYLAGFSWREGEPEDPEAWLDLYRDLTRAGVVPGGDD